MSRRGRILALVLAVVAPGFFVHDLHALQGAVGPCDRFQVALRADPNNVQAASGLGQCSFGDDGMLAPGGDSTRLVFRTSWSTALRALRHAVSLQPTNSAVYRPLFAILLAETRDGCSYATGECRHVAAVVRDGDSVITLPRPVQLNVPGADTYGETVRESHARGRGNVIEARALAQRWAMAAPDDWQPHAYAGQASLRLGEPAAAASELEYAATLVSGANRRSLFWDRLEALVRADRGTDARRLLDEALSDPGRDTAELRGYTVGAFNALLGRYRPPAVDSAAARRFRMRVDSMQRMGITVSARPPGFEQLLAAGDTAAARRLLSAMDSSTIPPSGVRMFPRVHSTHLQSAEYHLALRDTAGAEARLNEIERAFSEQRFKYFTLFNSDPSPWLGRAWSLSGDIAAARGQPDAAARMYRRVVGLWGGGDPNLQPIVDHARARLEALPKR